MSSKLDIVQAGCPTWAILALLTNPTAASAMPYSQLHYCALCQRKAREVGTEHGDVYKQIAALARQMNERLPETSVRAFDELLTNAVKHIPGAQYAGITIVARREEIATPAATHEHARTIDSIQEKLRQGPCFAGRPSTTATSSATLRRRRGGPIFVLRRWRKPKFARSPRSSCSLPVTQLAH